MRLSFLIPFFASTCFASYIGSGRTLMEKATSKIHLYNTVPGQTMSGDTLPFYNELSDGKKPAGHASGVCTYVDTSTLVWECRYTISVDDGDLTFQGDLIQSEKCSVQVLVTGTGSYTNAEGTDTLCWPEEGSIEYPHKIEIKNKKSPSFNNFLVEEPNVQTHVYYSAFGIKSVGDLNPYYNKLYDSENNKKLGDLYGACTYLQIDPTIIQQCSSLYEIEGGKIASLGILKQAEECGPQAVGGGSGNYLGAQGVMNLCWPEGINGNYTHDIKLDEPSTKPTGKYIVVEKPTTNTHIYNTQYGVVSEGDVVPFMNELFDESAEKKIGTVYGVCTYVKVSPRQWACEMTYETETGQVMVSGVYGDSQDCQKLGIVGGTKGYKGADGYVDVCWPSLSDTYVHTLNFDDSQKKDAASSSFSIVIPNILGFVVLVTAFFTL